MTATKLELTFTPKQISYLAHTSCKSFVGDQPGRFVSYPGPPENTDLLDSGWLHWMEDNTYLSALIMQQACIARGYQASILTDEHNENRVFDRAEWVVWTNDPLDMEKRND